MPKRTRRVAIAERVRSVAKWWFDPEDLPFGEHHGSPFGGLDQDPGFSRFHEGDMDPRAPGSPPEKRVMVGARRVEYHRT